VQLTRHRGEPGLVPHGPGQRIDGLVGDALAGRSPVFGSLPAVHRRVHAIPRRKLTSLGGPALPSSPGREVRRRPLRRIGRQGHPVAQVRLVVAHIGGEITAIRAVVPQFDVTRSASQAIAAPHLAATRTEIVVLITVHGTLESLHRDASSLRRLQAVSTTRARAVRAWSRTGVPAR
jgi:hypothetical protein